MTDSETNDIWRVGWGDKIGVGCECMGSNRVDV